MLRILLVESHGHHRIDSLLKKKREESVQLRIFSHWPCMRLLPHPVLQRAKWPWSSDVLVQMLWVRPVWCSTAAAQSWCHGAIQLQRNMSHLKLPFLPGGWISLLPNHISSSFLQTGSRNVQWLRTFLYTASTPTLILLHVNTDFTILWLSNLCS